MTDQTGAPWRTMNMSAKDKIETYAEMAAHLGIVLIFFILLLIAFGILTGIVIALIKL